MKILQPVCHSKPGTYLKKLKKPPFVKAQPLHTLPLQSMTSNCPRAVEDNFITKFTASLAEWKIQTYVLDRDTQKSILPKMIITPAYFRFYQSSLGLFYLRII
jgi:hypothetical protein